jgi:hypothetical protein
MNLGGLGTKLYGLKVCCPPLSVEILTYKELILEDEPLPDDYVIKVCSHDEVSFPFKRYFLYLASYSHHIRTKLQGTYM